jgi:hypothetical protein
MSRFTPTNATPGSEMKIAVLEYRVQHRQPLWHPRDKVEPRYLGIMLTPTGLDRLASAPVEVDEDADE